MTAFYNLSSLILGLMAWGLAGAHIGLRRKLGAKMRAAFTAASFLACGLALTLQIAEIDHRVAIDDIGAVMDTSHALLFVAAVLLAFTALLNIAALALWPKGENTGNKY